MGDLRSAAASSGPLIGAHELAALLREREDVRLLDVRWSLGGPPGLPLYLEGHLPGAVYVDLDTELSTHGAPEDGRSPMPSIETLQAAARRWGVDEGDTIVAYDDAMGTSAGRAWWLLRHAGVGDVRVLDGALGAWRAAGFELETGDVEPDPGNVTLSYGSLEILDVEAVRRFPATGVLLDARPADRFTGEVEPLEPRAGHIPGARNAPAPDNFASDGTFRPVDELRARFEALGVRAGAPVAVYCGAGTTCSANAIALTLAGFTPAIYPGSWSQWAARPELPIETGPSAAAT